MHSLCLYGVYEVVRKKTESFIRTNFKVNRICHPLPNMPLWYTDYLEPQVPRKQQMQKEVFSELTLSAQRQILPKELNCHKSPAEQLHQPGKMGSDHQRGEEKSTPHRDKLCHKLLYLSILLRTLIFPINHLLSYKIPIVPSLLSLLGWHLHLSSKPPRGVPPLSLVVSHEHMRSMCQ